MIKKSGSVMVIKFLISTIIAFLVFYFIMYRSCSHLPMLHDRAESTIAEIEKNVNDLGENVNFRRQTLVLSKDKALFFFENSSNRIVMNEFNRKYMIIRPAQYCHYSKPCFCFCDVLEQVTSEKCNIQLACKQHKLACKSFDVDFSFQNDQEGFFEDSSSGKNFVFDGGFFISSKHNVDTAVNRAPLVFHKDNDVIHLCSKNGNCLLEDRNSIIQPLLDRDCK